MAPDLGTVNLTLGIMAAVSVLEALVLLGLAVAGYMVYRRVSMLIETLEAQHVAPAMARVNGILDDMKDVTSRVREETDRVDRAIRTTMDRVDDTADRVRTNVRARASWIVGFVRGLRVALAQFLTTEG
jgi:pyrimidine operon attenuation protein/uracil phosphoribosyltransferase